MLRQQSSSVAGLIGCGLMLILGVLCAVLVARGNPGNMGLCGACFLRDVAGSMRLSVEGAPKYFRPEIIGLVLGAFVARRKHFDARSGSHAASRFLLGMLMAFGALVFLGCPFRMLQRIGGGDVHAMIGLVGLVIGVFVAYQFEKRGYSIGKTTSVPRAVGLLPILALTVLLWMFIQHQLAGPGPDDVGDPKHARWIHAFGIALLAGLMLSATKFCAIGAIRQAFSPGRKFALVALVLLVVGYAVTSMITGNFKFGTDGQPIAHADALWNVLALVLVGLTGAFAGGCPVRQIVMTGEGNADAFMTVAGITVGGALAHNFGMVSSVAGPTAAGKTVVIGGIVVTLLCAAWITRVARASSSAAAPPPKA